MPPRARSTKTLAKMSRCPQRYHFSRLVSLLVEVRDYVHEKIRTPQDSGACEHPYATYRRWIETNAQDEFLISRNFNPHVPSLTKKNYYSAYMFGMLVKPFTDAGHRRNPHLFDTRPWQVFQYYRFSQSIINVELIRFSLMVNRDGPRYKPSISLPENTVTSFEVVVYLLYIGQIMFPRRPDADSTHRGARKVIFPSFRINSRHINRFTTAVTTVVRSWDNFAHTCRFQSIEALTAPYVNFNISVYLFSPLRASEGFAPLHQANSLLNNPPPTKSPTDGNSYPMSAALEADIDKKLRAITTVFLSDLTRYLLDDELFAERNLESSPVSAFLQRSKTFDSLPRRFDEISDQVSELQSMAKEGCFDKAFGSVDNIPNFHSLPSTNFNNEHVVYVTKPPKRHRAAPRLPEGQLRASDESSSDMDQDYQDVSTSEHTERHDVSNRHENATSPFKTESSEHSPTHPPSPKRIRRNPRSHASFPQRLPRDLVGNDENSSDEEEVKANRSENGSESERNDPSNSDYSGSSWPPRDQVNDDAVPKNVSHSTRVTRPRAKRNAQAERSITHRTGEVRLDRKKINHRMPRQSETSSQQHTGNRNPSRRKSKREQDSECEEEDNKVEVQHSKTILDETIGIREESSEHCMGVKQYEGGLKAGARWHSPRDHSERNFNEPYNSEHNIGDFEKAEGKAEDLHNEDADDQGNDDEVTRPEQAGTSKLTTDTQEATEMVAKKEPLMSASVKRARQDYESQEDPSSSQIVGDPTIKTSPVVVLSDDGDEVAAVKEEKQEVGYSEAGEVDVTESKKKKNRRRTEKSKTNKPMQLFTDVPCSSFPVISTLPMCIMNGLGASWGRSRDMRDLHDYPTQMWPVTLIKAIDEAEECLMRMAELTHRSVYVDSSRMEPGQTGVFALEEFAAGDVICEFFGTLVYECERDVKGNGPETVILKTGQLENNLRVTKERFNASAVALPRLNHKWKLSEEMSVQRVYVVPCKTSVAATIVNTLILGNESEERMFVKERGTNAALTWKRGTQGIEKKAHMCETAAMGVIAIRDIRADEEICAAYETGLDSATKMLFSPAP